MTKLLAGAKRLGRARIRNPRALRDLRQLFVLSFTPLTTPCCLCAYHSYQIHTYSYD